MNRETSGEQVKCRSTDVENLRARAVFDIQMEMIDKQGFFDYDKLRKQALKNLVKKVHEGDWNATKAVINGELKLMEKRMEKGKDNPKEKEKEDAKRVADAFGG